MARIAIATMTRARDAGDESLLFRSLERLSRHRYPLFITDSGSRPDFVARLAELPEASLGTSGATLVAQVQSSLRRACACADLVLYTEPDKAWFFEHAIPELTARALRQPAAITVCARDESSLATYPEGQRFIESRFNELAGFFLGRTEDLLYGPLILNARLTTPYLEELTPDLGWGWRPYLIARCTRAGHQLRFHTGPFPCPPEQRTEDDPASRLYRLAQLAQNVEGLRRGLNK